MARKTPGNSVTIPKKAFHLEFLNSAQKMAWAAFEQHEVLFLIGPAGTGKSFLATAFAIGEILAKKRDRIVITRPIVESGESLGFLPGSFEEKVHPYMMPIYDCVGKLVGWDGPQREKIDRVLEVAPLAYLRGRAQPLDAKILTSSGYKLMGDVKLGDKIMGFSGETEIVGVYPQGFKDVFKVSLSDGTSVECCGDHLWLTQTLSEKRHNKPYSVKTTNEIRNNCKTSFNQKNHKLPITQANFPNVELPVNPYLLGLLLGDGHIRNGAVKFTTTDAELLNEIQNRMPDGMTISPCRGIDFNLVDKNKTGRYNTLLKSLKELGLVGKKSYDKFIPDIYKFNSFANRLEVLRGLLDTDGWIDIQGKSGNCRIQYSSVSEQLADDVCFLVRSMGGVAYKRIRHFNDEGHDHKGKIIRHCRSSYIIEIVFPADNPFRLKRKANKYSKSAKPVRLIESVEVVGRKECQCVKVQAQDGLYLTDYCIVTHNTFDDAVCIFDEAQNATFSQLKLFLTRFGENSKIIVTGDPLQSDLKGEVALANVVERLKTEPGIGVIEFNNANIVRHPLVGRILERLG